MSKCLLSRWYPMSVAVLHSRSIDDLLYQTFLGHRDLLRLFINFKADAEEFRKASFLGQFKSIITQLFHKIVNHLCCLGGDINIIHVDDNHDVLFVENALILLTVSESLHREEEKQVGTKYVWWQYALRMTDRQT